LSLHPRTLFQLLLLLVDDSGTGVAFSRNPSTGENVMYGEYLINAQGEDVVAGKLFAVTFLLES
jgi:phosphoenolpyruvate synthase/pyruvate phosphate dikinase